MLRGAAVDAEIYSAPNPWWGAFLRVVLNVVCQAVLFAFHVAFCLHWKLSMVAVDSLRKYLADADPSEVDWGAAIENYHTCNQAIADMWDQGLAGVLAAYIALKVAALCWAVAVVA